MKKTVFNLLTVLVVLLETLLTIYLFKNYSYNNPVWGIMLTGSLNLLSSVSALSTIIIAFTLQMTK